MKKIIANRRTGIGAALALAASVAVGMTATDAHAAVVGQLPVNAIEYSAGTLLIQLNNGVNYVGVLSAVAGCTANNQTNDTLLRWQSMSESAIASGRKLKIFFNTCGGNNYIVTLDYWSA